MKINERSLKASKVVEIMYKRVLLKLSGEALSANGNSFDPTVLANLARELKEVH